MAYPEFGTAPIRCAKRGCDWRGMETDLVAGERVGKRGTQNVCPKCGGKDYYFMTEKEVAKWEREKTKAIPAHGCGHMQQRGAA